VETETMLVVDTVVEVVVVVSVLVVVENDVLVVVESDGPREYSIAVMDANISVSTTNAPNPTFLESTNPSLSAPFD
jgi:hypothetical protein